MRTTWKVSGLLFCSGACALIYQTVWMRQFRLIFGASTAATAAVLAIFMGGLGVGSAILGRRADRAAQPLRFYGNLELLIATVTALSQPLLWLTAKIYFATGGSVTLGLFLATILRLLLATIVLGAATFVMGGTLPAAARAVETTDDQSRRRVALLYGANTFGAVAGTLLSTFVALELLGNRNTLFVAVVVNVCVGLLARLCSGGLQAAGGLKPAATQPVLTPTHLAAAIVGFAFLLMELVWYRMLAPLLGGTTFTFGLILAIALLGIGLGGASYAFGGLAATKTAFALTCAAEALAIAIPFALGDRLAIFELYLRSLGSVGFTGFVIAWTLLTAIVVLPAAFIAGIQFPLLISLAGRGEEDVGADVGALYAWNTAGAIAGSLAGGFGLLPLLGAPNVWRFVVAVLALLAIAAAGFSARVSHVVAIASIAAIFALGPTAVWRHSGIGAGRAESPDSANSRTEWMYRTRRTTVWDRDGRESSVALVDGVDYAFMVNGKADGSARGDAGTQVMAGLVPAILHPHPQRALVVGLGTGSTAGWLGSIPEMQRVDVVELEPAILGVARACSTVNRDVLHNAKVHIRIGDAREVLLATPQQYDIVFSEPSNPYRAGIASLFTQEFYRASAARLRHGGIFGQWVQAYEIDAQTLRTIYATLASVFPHVETWTTDTGDLLLVASPQPIAYDFDRLRQRVASEPFRTALENAWRVETIEGFIAHFLARDALARAIAGKEHELNTDDRTLVEFGFGRGVGAKSLFSMDDLAMIARTRDEDRPLGRGSIDWRTVGANRAGLSWVDAVMTNAPEEDHARHRASSSESPSEAVSEWRAHAFVPSNSGELALIAEGLADGGSEAAEPYAEQLRRWNPIDADAVLAKLRFRQSRLDECAHLLERAFIASRRNPWPTVDLIGRTLDLAQELAAIRSYAPVIFHALDQPFAAGQWEDTRRIYRVTIAYGFNGCGPLTQRALRDLEPWTMWREDILRIRRDCYRTPQARRDYDRFAAAEPLPFNRELTPLSR